ncbi:MAG: hypothetical protein ACI845_002526 [Gammaproteobacteria bacterium]|jgi:hypothetical protein
MRKYGYWVSIILVVVTLSSCALLPKPDQSNPILTVAVLPFSNFSNNVDAPENLRKQYIEKFESKFYKVISVKKIDRILLDDFGITLGDQIDDVDFDEIKEKIGADGYVFGHITHYVRTVSGVLNSNRVRTEMKMIQASNNNLVWQSQIGVKSESKSDDLLGNIASLASAISDVKEDSGEWITIERQPDGDGSILGNLGSGLIESIIGTATDTLLTEESHALIELSTSKLRHGPGD